MKKRSFAVVGGDKRSVLLCGLLKKDGHEVRVFGLEQTELDCTKTLEDAMLDADIIIGPVPCSRDGVHLHAPLAQEPILVQELFTCLHGKPLIAGQMGALAGLPCTGILFDLLERPELALLNAVPTAEGVLMLAIQNSAITLHGANCMVLGYGKTGKILARDLLALGAKVSVTARSAMDLDDIGIQGYTPLTYKTWTQALPEADFIFNTVPKVLLGEEELRLVKSECLLIDIASKPFGVDYEAANRLGLHAMCAPSLPGTVAPLSAAKYLRDAIYQIAEPQG